MAQIESAALSAAARRGVPVAWAPRAVSSGRERQARSSHGVVSARASREAESRVQRSAVGPLAKQAVVLPPVVGRDAAEAPLEEPAAWGGAAGPRAVEAARDVGAEPLAAEAVPAAAARRQGVAPDAAGEQPRGAVRLSAVAWAFRRGRAPPSARLALQSAALFAHAKKYLRTALP